ncbi:8019_t:CDS:2 [Ambispora gerdemannii]|uniref:8019_t:CDS:1 n=1 Tax=Ambispora gerdemannii TaxID=144530 RepID=A0A9N8WHG5_9GLOM|nr:8019_t:CDS:2 [Ambispora gerdemannii]
MSRYKKALLQLAISAFLIFSVNAEDCGTQNPNGKCNASAGECCSKWGGFCGVDNAWCSAGRNISSSTSTPTSTDADAEKTSIHDDHLDLVAFNKAGVAPLLIIVHLAVNLDSVNAIAIVRPLHRKLFQTQLPVYAQLRIHLYRLLTMVLMPVLRILGEQGDYSMEYDTGEYLEQLKQHNLQQRQLINYQQNLFLNQQHNLQQQQQPPGNSNLMGMMIYGTTNIFSTHVSNQNDNDTSSILNDAYW